MDEAAVLKKLDVVSGQIQDVRERLIRLETQGYHDRLTKMEDEHDLHRDRITILETKGRFFTAGVSAGVAMIVSGFGALVSYILRG